MLGSLPPSARITARQMLEFLKLLRMSSPMNRLMSGRAAEIIVGRFKQDLLDLNVVTQMSDFDGARHDATVHDTSVYVRRIFVADNLPPSMSVKSCLQMSLDLELPDLQKEIAKKLAKMVPRTTVHGRWANFSSSALTLLVGNSVRREHQCR